MKKIIYFEWLHFSRNIARPIAVFLFLLAAVFGLYNGADSYNKRQQQVNAIGERRAETHETAYEWFDSGEAGPEDRPWVDINAPFWSMWYATHYLIQEPAPAMVYNIGQSDHFGYYKRVSMWSTAFDDDLTSEIANPELVQIGALDFTFVWLYLMPLLLIVLTYHTKGLEQDLGFIPLLKIQQPAVNNWVIKRLGVIGLGLLLLLTLLIFVPAGIYSELSLVETAMSLWLVYMLYLLLWLVIVFLVIRYGKGQADQALKMIGIWLLLTVAIPGLVNQYVLLKKPADLMMAMIEASREGQSEIYDTPEDQIISKAFVLHPDLKQTQAAKYDSLREQPMINSAYRIVLNQYMGEVSAAIIQNQIDRNRLITSTSWVNPVTAFHNWINRLTETGHEANLDFRVRIKKGGEIVNRKLALDEWNNKKMDKAAFQSYRQLLNQDNHE